MCTVVKRSSLQKGSKFVSKVLGSARCHKSLLFLLGGHIHVSDYVLDFITLCYGSAVVEHSTHNPKIMGSNHAPGAGGEKMTKMLKTLFLLSLKLWQNELVCLASF